MFKMGTVHKITQNNNSNLWFLSNWFLAEKKDEGNLPVINLKDLKSFIPCKHFKMKDIHSWKFLLQEKDFLCEIDFSSFKKAIFSGR